MNQPFLILHRVRDAPAFDIAEKIGEDSQGDIWIIPTSGHRAYPAMWWNMSMLECKDGQPIPTYNDASVLDFFGFIPDHYSCNAPSKTAKPAHRGLGQSLLASLGLTKKINRRF